LSIGTGGYSGTAMAGHFLQRADVIFGIGCSFTATIFGAPIPAGKIVIHLTNNEADVNKDIVAEHALLGDARLVLRQLIEEVKRQGGHQPESPVNDIAALKRAWLTEWQPLLASDETPLNPYRVLHDLMTVVDRTRTI